MMIAEGWDAVKTKVIKEEMMPTAMKIEDLKDWDGHPLDLSKPDFRENDVDEDPEYASDPPTFNILSIAQLQEWNAAGRPVPEGSHNAGSEQFYKKRSIKHPSDPLGLVADKLGRAIANERLENGQAGGKRIEPVFVHVYSLGHASVMKQVDKGLELIGCGAFHAGCECYGVEWSYGYNDQDTFGIFPSPPKYCDMHEYKESHYIGDTTVTEAEFECWLQFLTRKDYKQEDPLDENFPKRVPRVGETPAEFFGAATHELYTDELNPITKEADIGEVYDYKDSSRMWTKFEDTEGNEVITRVGWWGDEYELLDNNCCYLTDHLLKILVHKPLPSWIFSLAKIGDGLAFGAHFVHEGLLDGVNQLGKGLGRIKDRVVASVSTAEEGIPSTQKEMAQASDHKSVEPKRSGCCSGRPE